MRGKSAQEQQAAVARVLLSLIPRHLPYIIRTFFKPTRLSLELNALFTPSIFSWLVGPAEVRNGQAERKLDNEKTRASGWGVGSLCGVQMFALQALSAAGFEDAVLDCFML